MPQTILNDKLLCKLAERGDLKGVTRTVDRDGNLVWLARFFYVPCKFVHVGTFQTALEAINAVRERAALYRQPTENEKLFGKDGRINVRGVQWDKIENRWRVSFVRVEKGLRSRCLVGYRNSFVEAVHLCLDADHMTWAEIDAYSHKTNARPARA